MKVDILIASTGEHSLITEIKDGLHINLDDFHFSLDVIQQAHLTQHFSGIIGTDDSTVELATLAAQKLGLIHNPPYSAKLTQRKDLARACLKHHNCIVPNHRVIKLLEPIEEQLIDITWPCVIKPLNMSASRGVIRVNNISECLIACKRVTKIISVSDNVFEQRHLLLEEYIDGAEVAFEAYLENGQLHQLAIFEKPNPLVGPYFEETIYVTPCQLKASVQKHIKQRVSEACEAYGLITGPIHAELRIDSSNEAWILEVANRSIGGDCGRTLDGSIEYFLEKLIISLAIGISPPIPEIENAQGVMMIPIQKPGILKEIEGIESAKKVKDITGVSININLGNELIPLPEGNQYLGYIFAESDTSAQVIDALNTAHDKLTIHVMPKIKLIQD